MSELGCASASKLVCASCCVQVVMSECRDMPRHDTQHMLEVPVKPEVESLDDPKTKQEPHRKEFSYGKTYERWPPTLLAMASDLKWRW